MTRTSNVDILIGSLNLTVDLKRICEKILKGNRISVEEGLLLYDRAELGLLGLLANYIREQKHGDKTYFNRNFHIEPTNKCVFDCKFCSYSRSFQQQEDAWELSE